MRKKVSFKSPAELAVALESGRIFYTEDNAKLFYDKSKKNPFQYRYNGSVCSIESSWQNFDNLEELIPWEENFKPCFCWVDNECQTERELIILIVSYNDDYTKRFESYFDAWKYATPLTKSELMEYCYE